MFQHMSAKYTHIHFNTHGQTFKQYCTRMRKVVLLLLVVLLMVPTTDECPSASNVKLRNMLSWENLLSCENHFMAPSC